MIELIGTVECTDHHDLCDEGVHSSSQHVLLRGSLARKRSGRDVHGARGVVRHMRLDKMRNLGDFIFSTVESF